MRTSVSLPSCGCSPLLLAGDQLSPFPGICSGQPFILSEVVDVLASGPSFGSLWLMLLLNLSSWLLVKRLEMGQC